ARLLGRGRRPVDPARRDRANDRRARAALTLGKGRCQAPLPARHRHALGGRALRRGRRLRSLRSPRAADELPRARPLREHLRPDTPARRDHQIRLPPRTPAPGRGRLALPPPATHRHDAPTAPARPARPDDRDLLESTAAPPPALAPTRQRTRQAQDDRRGRCRPPPRRLLLGDHEDGPEPLNEPNSTPRLRKRQPTRPHAREHPRSNYEQPPPRRRSILDSGLSRRNPVLRYPTRAYQSDRASRTRRACRSPSRAPTSTAEAPRQANLHISSGGG